MIKKKKEQFNDVQNDNDKTNKRKRETVEAERIYFRGSHKYRRREKSEKRCVEKKDLLRI